MNIIASDKADLDKFKRLDVETLISLALHVPASYDDRRLRPELIAQAYQTIDATVESVSRTPQTLRLTLYVHNFGHSIDAVIFRPKPYMSRQFVVDERYYLHGKIECSAGRCQMTHPQKVRTVGAITPKYKTALRNDVMGRLIARYITSDALQEEGLPEKVASQLTALHFPPADQPMKRSEDDTQAVLYALKFSELFDHMRRLKRRRDHFPALHAVRSPWRAWSEALPFTLTAEQLKTISDIEKDLAKEMAARRMVVGDVGSGKTMVMMAAVMMARPHRSILMAPTTILADQLYEEAQKYLHEVASVLVTNKSKKVSLESYELIIGTHALLYRDLPEAALVMIDEQHRFGTAQRSRLEKLIASGRRRPHLIQFSATPIPRTQAMIDSAHIDVSLITQTPFKKDIATSVIHREDFKALMEHIKSEIAQQHQVLLVYPLVEQSEVLEYQSIDEARTFWERNFEQVYVTHGKDKAKEEVLTTFKEQGDILLATTVVEVGISLPRLSTVVIVGAERLGLSTLHQLRGRVSRTGLKGYCFLFTHQKSSERLDAFTKTDNGFDIAQLDLKFRQSGDLLTGKNQSGKRFRWVDMAEDEAIIEEVKEHLKIEDSKA